MYTTKKDVCVNQIVKNVICTYTSECEKKIHNIYSAFNRNKKKVLQIHIQKANANKARLFTMSSRSS